MKKSLLSAALVAAGLFLFCIPCAAKGAVPAKELTQSSTISLLGSSDHAALVTDGDETTRVWFKDGGKITLKGTQKTAALYLVWDLAPKNWQLHTSNGAVNLGKNRYLHQYVPLPAAQSTVKISFEGSAVLCELRSFTKGTPPQGVQNWSAPLKKADLLLLPTHADDEHLYFGGTMASCKAKGKSVQVAYMVNHQKEPHRQHELLNGLWRAGIRHYPIIPPFEDIYSDSLAHAKTIYDEQALLTYQIELIRRFRPEVIVGHDVNGEYGHGAHRLNAVTLQKAVSAAADQTIAPESARRYGAWNPKKTYLHLWQERTVVMNWDLPLPAFGGATAFETAVSAFSCHTSQQDYFKVEQSGAYDCRKFGLFRTTVGEDLRKNDFFEHI